MGASGASSLLAQGRLRHERIMVGTREWLLTFGVIVVPLAIAAIVTLWTLEQARYRPKRKRPPGTRRDDAPATEPPASSEAISAAPAEPAEPAT